MRPALLTLPLFLGAAAVAFAPQGCGSDDSTPNPVDAGADTSTTPSEGGSDAGADAAPLPIGQPITATQDTWTWVDFPDSSCDDGSPTGIGIYPSSKSDKLAFYFEGGGACWSYVTCVQLSTSTHGPFGATQFAATKKEFIGSLFDKTTEDGDAGDAGLGDATPLADYSLIYIPYCTGDVHAGDADTTYTSAAGDQMQVVHHKGRANVAAYLARVAATFKTPSQVVVTGSSAGGGGTLFNYPRIRAYWPTVTSVLIDDSLPLFEGSDGADGGTPADLLQAWYSSWNLGPIADPLCPTCRNDLSQLYPSLTALYPDDRMSLLESEQDEVIRQFYLDDAAQFQAGLNKMQTDVLSKLPNWRHYFISGQTHTMLGHPTDFPPQGQTATPLLTWLTQQITGDAAWASVDP